MTTTRTINTIRIENKILRCEKLLKRFCIGVAVVLLAFSFFNLVYADATGVWTAYQNGLTEIRKGPTAAPEALVEAMYTAQFFSSMDFIIALCDVNVTVSWNNFATVLQQGYNIFASLGYALVVMFALVELTNKIQMEQLSPEILIRWVVQLIAGVVVINKGFNMFGGLLSIGETALEKVKALSLASTFATTSMTYSTTELLKTGVLSLLSSYLSSGITMIFVLIAAVYMYVLLLGRAIEICVRVIFAPIAIADVASHGLNSPGWNYIRKFLGVCLQGAVLTVIMRSAGFVSSLATGLSTVPILSSVQNIIILVSMLGVMIKSQQLVGDITGAH